MSWLKALTRCQREIYDYIAASLHDRGFAPSLQEIADVRGLRSLATVHEHVESLAAKGYLTRDWNRSRSIRLVVHRDQCPTCGQTVVR